ncbi:hypothetical protein [Cypionkella sp. TWP1-2-1b2]|uniref:hypothetical protein n=1 Tax=Cypionkella sp. TWP1-2-1b2 TaxID=2804675 RepID=UPI003CF155A9
MDVLFGGSIRFSTTTLRSGEYPKSSSYPAHLRNRVKIEQRTTSQTQRVYRIVDNKLTELVGWDGALLLQELQALLAEDFDLGLIGIPENELDALLADADESPAISDDAADAILKAPANPITRSGDIFWALGKHRLCCGGATDPAAVARLMQGEQATLMFTSPPYAQQ